MGVLADPPIRVRDPDLTQELLRLVDRAGGLGDLAADLHRRVERGHRILEHGAGVLAAGEAALLRRCRDHLGGSQRSLTGELRLLGRQPQQREPEQRLARAGLADEAEDLAAPELEVDPAKGVGAVREPGVEAANPGGGGFGHLLRVGLVAVLHRSRPERARG